MKGKKELTNLPPVASRHALFVGEGDMAHQLLGNGTGADRPSFLIAHVADDGGDDSRCIKTRIRPERIVFDGNGGIDDMLGDFLIVEPPAFLRRF
jgi:hypothetical protein